MFVPLLQTYKNKVYINVLTERLSFTIQSQPADSMPMSQRSTRGRSRSRSVSRGRKRMRTSSRGRSSRYQSDDVNMTTNRIMIPRAGLSGPTFTFSRWTDVSSIHNTNDGTEGGVVASAALPNTVYQGKFSLNLVNGYGDFQNLFAQYRIVQLEYHLLNWQATALDTPVAAGQYKWYNTPVYLGAQNDTLGATAGNELRQCQQEEGVVVRDYINGGKPFIIKVVNPTWQTPATDNAGNYQPGAGDSKGWLDTQLGAGIDYRGYFLGLQDSYNALGRNAIATVAFTVRVKCTMQFRGLR